VIVVNAPVLGVAFPIGEFCNPPVAVKAPVLALNVNFGVETLGV
jgi:hypothetical protein